MRLNNDDGSRHACMYVLAMADLCVRFARFTAQETRQIKFMFI